VSFVPRKLFFAAVTAAMSLLAFATSAFATPPDPC
jgi:hypothetical protein